MLCKKGQCHEIFCFLFFYESVFTQPQSIKLGPFWIFSKIRRDIRKPKCTTGINNTGGKFATGVNDTGSKLPPVSTTSAANLPPVLTTPVANFCHHFPLCCWYRWQICHRCQRYWRQIFRCCRWQFATGINDAGGKFATGVIDTGGI